MPKRKKAKRTKKEPSLKDRRREIQETEAFLRTRREEYKKALIEDKKREAEEEEEVCAIIGRLFLDETGISWKALDFTALIKTFAQSREGLHAACCGEEVEHGEAFDDLKKLMQDRKRGGKTAPAGKARAESSSAASSKKSKTEDPSKADDSAARNGAAAGYGEKENAPAAAQSDPARQKMAQRNDNASDRNRAQQQNSSGSENRPPAPVPEKQRQAGIQG